MAEKTSAENNSPEASAKSSVVSFGDGAQISGNVAGRDIIVTSDFESRADELAEVLELRAEKIQDSLAIFYKYVPVQDYLAKFRDLHSRHIQSLRNKQLLLAHEILLEIHRLSFKLESEEFWTRHRIETPFLSYSLRHNAFQRGHLICEYVAGDASSYSERYPSSKGYGGGFDLSDSSRSNMQLDRDQAAEVYTIIMQTSRQSAQESPESL